MSKTKLTRQETVEALQAEFQASPNVYVTDFTGLNVTHITDLRRRLRNAGVKYLVVKNTLAQRALAANAVRELDAHLTGPTGFVLAGTNPVGAAKVLAEFVKEHERPAIKGGMLDGKLMSTADVTRLASLPSREVLLAQVAGTFQAPLAGFAGVMSGLLYQMVGALEALRAERSAQS